MMEAADEEMMEPADEEMMEAKDDGFMFEKDITWQDREFNFTDESSITFDSAAV